MNKGIIGIIILTVVIFIGIVTFGSTSAVPDNPALNSFAQCVADSGTTFYGAFWCPNCVSQKAAFGSAAELLPYVECSTLDRQGQLPVCRDAGIEAYPTWEFPEGERVTGAIALESIAAGSGCELPAEFMGTNTDDLVEAASSTEAVMDDGATTTEDMSEESTEATEEAAQ